MRRVHVPETPTTKAMRPDWPRMIVAALCAYETTAILTGRVPTITTLNRRHPVVGVVLVGALALHFWTPAPI
jgi:hypothetical protein